MRRRKEAAPFSPVPSGAKVAVAASLGDINGNDDCRFLLIKFPEDWQFKGVDDRRLADRIETVIIGRRHPEGLPAGRYLRLPVDPLVDPWGRVAIGLEFETPNGTQSAELTVQTREDEATRPALDGSSIGEDNIRLYANSLLNLTGKSTVFFVEGSAGDVLDLTDDEAGHWSVSDSDGSHRLYIRRDRSGRRSAALAVRCGIEVKLA